MEELDEEKTTFHTSQGVYCYTKMPFGIKNVGATYERLVNKAFDNQVGRNIEVYIDDLVIKSYMEAEMLRDIEETFRTLRKINMKLNPKKCTFGAAEGMLLGYTITSEGIKPCPDKTEAVLQLSSLRTIKDVQSLNGKLASLNRFLSKAAEKSLPLFKTLKKCIKKSDFHWTSKAEQAFMQLKQHPSELPLLVAPKLKEELIIYMANRGHASQISLQDRCSVVAKAMRLGYYWPTMHRDALEMIRTCNDCQIHRPVPRNPQHKLTPITAPWPFYKWGIDIAGPFPERLGKVKFLIVTMDYFTKWIEAKAVATITGNQVKKNCIGQLLVWPLFRSPPEKQQISDNGKQFSDNPFKDWCDKLNITQLFASVKHPQSNGLVERANRSLGEGIKARLGEGNKNWVEELPHVL
ncbi:reverse transcriptase domain-containing protein [Tanacetum coccineum]|uniref:Reverse transcriptase domain-containing protein n=1 Tax=Tanacetum coccineum TaxID=301880 RepID=A0ABQ5F026_9ASTR